MDERDSKGRFLEGSKHSNEWRKKMSDNAIKKGIKPPIPRKGVPSGMLGKKHSKETRLKMSLAAKGRKLSEETRKNQSVAFKKFYKEHPGARAGENHPQWKGGVSKDKEYKKKYRKENKDKYMFLRARYRVKKHQNGGTHTFGEWQTLKTQYNFTCPSCKKSEPQIKLTEDHIIPISRGGSDNIENIQPLCRICNSTKHTRIIKFK